MFTGIIQQMGTLVRVDARPGQGRLMVHAKPWDPPLAIGESVAVQGVCLTLVQMEPETLQFDILRETFERTNLRDKKPGEGVNLERALRYGDPLGGHLVNGHVDGVGEVIGLDQIEDRDWAVRLRTHPDIMEFVAPQGSIACDGVSLTVVETGPDYFTVHIIPHTRDITTFSRLKTGDRVNLEVDVLARYARRPPQGPAAQNLSWETLDRTRRAQRDG